MIDLGKELGKTCMVPDECRQPAEMDFPIAEAARPKSIRPGHPSMLYLWRARRPLASSRAVKIEFDLQTLLPESEWSFFSQALIIHGRHCCTAPRSGSS